MTGTEEHFWRLLPRIRSFVPPKADIERGERLIVEKVYHVVKEVFSLVVTFVRKEKRGKES